MLEANGAVVTWKRDAAQIRLHLRGHEPLRIAIAGATRCALRTPTRVVRARGKGQVVRFSLPEHDTGEATLGCD